jgi:ligand-binding sensor domain-containing protein
MLRATLWLLLAMASSQCEMQRNTFPRLKRTTMAPSRESCTFIFRFIDFPSSFLYNNQMFSERTPSELARLMILSLQLRAPWFLRCIGYLLLLSAAGRMQDSALAQRRSIPSISAYNIRSWTTNEGLPNNKVLAITQSAQGYIWLATQEGLVRFDGAGFEIFDKKNTPAIPHSEISGLAEDRDSTLWIGTIRGIVQYRQGKFHPVPVEESVGSFTSRVLATDKQGKCIVGTQSGILRVVNGRLSKGETSAGDSLLNVRAMCEDNEGQLWIGAADRGVNLMRGGKILESRHDGIPENASVIALCITRNQTVWVGTQSGLFVAAPGSPRKFSKVNALGDQVIHALLEDKYGCVWVGSEKNGLYRYVNGKFESISIREGLSADYITTLCEDREGNIWAGTFYNGVDEIWQGKFETISTGEGLAGPLARAIDEDSTGSVWIGTESGLTRWKNGNATTYTTKDGLPHNQIRSVCVDRQGVLWLGTPRGLSAFDGRHFRNYLVKDGLSNEYARVVTEDFDGNLWIGHNAQGIDRFTNGVFANMEHEGIPRVGIRVISRGSNRTMWIGTNDGLIRWRDGKSTFYKTDKGLPKDLFAIYEDRDHIVWIGTYGDGLFRLKDETITNITTKDGLFDDVVYQILEDDQQNFWMSSNRGVFRVARTELIEVSDRRIAKVNCAFYGTVDGMKSSECNGNSQPAGIRTRDGRMWFPTTNGVAVINPSDITLNAVPPEVTIENLRVDNSPVELAEHVSIDPGYSYLEIHYAGLSFVAPGKMIFNFTLDGFDKEWRKAGHRRVAYYTNVPPGEYVFRVRAQNNDGVWSKDDVTLRIELRPYFYQTWYFYCICGILLVGAMVFAYRRRVAMLLQREKELKQRVDESLAQIKVLGGLIPICSNCKKIRDDKGFWNQLEKYLKDHSEAQFTHGICPECKEQLYGPYLKKLGVRPEGDIPKE